jgi:D-glycero-alpha-D-manno-heptose-7-phosphate kinase
MFSYPEAAVSPLPLPADATWELERRMAIVYLGDAHVSSAVHAQVIENLEQSGADDHRLEELRRCALEAKDALYRCDFQEFGRIMSRNTQVQSQLHPSILSPRAREIVELARQHGLVGEKLNGAGGNGGSLTLLFGERTADKRAFVRELAEAVPEATVLPVALSSHGLRVWETRNPSSPSA